MKKIKFIKALMDFFKECETVEEIENQYESVEEEINDRIKKLQEKAKKNLKK